MDNLFKVEKSDMDFNPWVKKPMVIIGEALQASKIG